jgi:DNA-directed RNA polymerase specialized sigma24 family protein
MQPPEDGKDNVFSNELESPFRNFTPELKQTGIFIHRFFLRDSYKDIALQFGVSESNARVQYSNAVRKILENLELLDQDERKDIASIHYKKIFRKKAKAIPKNKKWWVMVNYFGMTPSEVAEIEGTTGRNVSSAICRFDEKVKAGITL